MMRDAQVTRIAGYGIVLGDAGRLLLCRLSADELYPGWWTLPGGGIDFGEDPCDAALRELTEETACLARSFLWPQWSPSLDLKSPIPVARSAFRRSRSSTASA
jgi:8-oxo-dGTP pyrophosphatase MutT (NUDIX family)